jgi:hypothetical protein
MGNINEINSYLKLYLGCEVLINNNVLENEIERLTYINELGDCGGNMHDWQAKDCTLILRAMGDFTEQEKKEGIEKFESTATIYSPLAAEYIKWHIEKKFDIFGLIAKKWAIDRATIHNGIW